MIFDLTVRPQGELIETGYVVTSAANGVVNKMTTYGIGSFLTNSTGSYGMNGIRELEINSGVTSIQNNTFRNSSIETLRLPNTITSLHSQAWRGCSQLTTPVLESGFDCDISFYESPNVTRQAILDMITAFAINSGKTITLHATAYALLSSDDLATATAKGLSIVSA